MTCYLFCCSVGILLVGLLPVLPEPAWSPLIIAVALALSGLGIFYPNLFTTAAAGAGLGLCWAILVCQDLLDTQVAPSWIGQSIWVEGEIAELPQTGAGMVRFVLEIFRAEPCGCIDGDSTSFDCAKSVRVRLSYFLADQDLHSIKPGETWRFQVKLKPPHGLVNSPTFNYEAWLLRHRIAATGYVQASPKPTLIEEQGHRRLFQQARFALREFVQDSLKYSPLKDLLVALTMGENQAISHDHWDTLSRTGTNHLLIISGLHVSLVIGMAYQLFTRLFTMLMTGPNAQTVSVTVAATAAVGYAGIAGFGLPVQRSLIMALVVFGSLLLGRAMKTRHIFLWALVVVTANDPLASYSIGFWLSFVAVMVLLLLFSGRYRLVPDQSAPLVNAVTAQWGIYICLFSLTAYLLLQVSVISPLANIVAIPVVSLLVVPCVLLAMSGWLVIGDPARLILHLADQVLAHLWSYLDLLARWDLVWIPPGMSVAGAVLGLLGGLLLLMPVGLPGRWLSVCLALPFIVPSPANLDPGEIRLRVLDVGQGLSVLIQTRRHSLVYDLGSKRNERFDMGEQVVAPVLRSGGISVLHMLVISNADNDHAGGAGALLNRIQVLELLSGDPANVVAATGIMRHVGSCAGGARWTWDNVEFAFLHPDTSTRWQGNDRSCVLLVSTGNKRALIPGDITHLVEQSLAPALSQPVELLVVPHHGSDTSSSPGFLNKLRPAFAVFSAGHFNRFDHPSPSVLDRYVNRGIKLFFTYADGAIVVQMDSTGVQSIEGDRQANRKFWYRQ